MAKWYISLSSLSGSVGFFATMQQQSKPFSPAKKFYLLFYKFYWSIWQPILVTIAHKSMKLIYSLLGKISFLKLKVLCISMFCLSDKYSTYYETFTLTGWSTFKIVFYFLIYKSVRYSSMPITNSLFCSPLALNQTPDENFADWSL